MSIDEIFQLTQIDPWFLFQIKQIVDMENQLAKIAASGGSSSQASPKPELWPASPMSCCGRPNPGDFPICSWPICLKVDADRIARHRKERAIRPAYKLVDTCAAEFRATTPYYYSTYEHECEARVSDRKKVMILGGGPNRIGQGIEFDYCCVHAAFALKDEGVESIMVNSNPETVSTDYDTSDKLYFEPLTKEDVLHIVEKERPFGVIVQFGGQTPLESGHAAGQGRRTHSGNPSG